MDNSVDSFRTLSDGDDSSNSGNGGVSSSSSENKGNNGKHLSKSSAQRGRWAARKTAISGAALAELLMRSSSADVDSDGGDTPLREEDLESADC